MKAFENIRKVVNGTGMGLRIKPDVKPRDVVAAKKSSFVLAAFWLLASLINTFAAAIWFFNYECSPMVIIRCFVAGGGFSICVSYFLQYLIIHFNCRVWINDYLDAEAGINYTDKEP